ncbi:DUF3954 domain-containing protein [Bacillus sp. NPDC077411]|uniref:DUF3954 domain-containing protein n=1 Tax=Bacillus sp. NPDC077411 TaxID=3363947 RepID=UPI0037CA879B
MEIGTAKNIQIDIKENAIYIVRNGKITRIDPPADGFGEQTAYWVNGVIDRVSTKSTLKIK